MVKSSRKRHKKTQPLQYTYSKQVRDTRNIGRGHLNVIYAKNDSNLAGGLREEDFTIIIGT